MPTYIYVQICLQKVLRPCPVTAVRFVKNDHLSPHIISLSPRSHVDPKIRASPTSNLSYLSGTVKFSSPCALALQSTFLVYLDDPHTLLHSEIAPLKCLSSAIKQSGWLYSSEIAPGFWDTLCSSSGRLILSYTSIFDQCDYIDLTRYTILQSLKPTPALHFESNAFTDSSRASPTVFIVYRFSYQELGLQTSFHTVAPDPSVYPASYPTHNQVNRRPNHLLNH
jgi:transcriptional enhancer factor